MTKEENEYNENYYNYISFVELKPKAKTRVFEVRNKVFGDLLGFVKWYAPWRRYCFFINGTNLVFDAGCLGEIASFIEKEMDKWVEMKKLNSLKHGLDIDHIQGV